MNWDTKPGLWEADHSVFSGHSKRSLEKTRKTAQREKVRGGGDMLPIRDNKKALMVYEI